MSDVLKTAIELALENRWDMFGWEPEDSHEWTVYLTYMTLNSPTDGATQHTKSLNDIIFNHDFAKALFGDDHIDILGHQHIEYAYQDHLQQLAISTDRLKYLQDYLTQSLKGE